MAGIEWYSGVAVLSYETPFPFLFRPVVSEDVVDMVSIPFGLPLLFYSCCCCCCCTGLLYLIFFFFSGVPFKKMFIILRLVDVIERIALSFVLFVYK